MEQKDFDLETEFKNLKAKQKEAQTRSKLKEKRVWYYILVLCLYAVLTPLISLIVSGIVMVSAINKPTRYTIKAHTQVINEIYLSPNKIGIITVKPFENSKKDFKNNFFDLPVNKSGDKLYWLIINTEIKKDLREKLIKENDQREFILTPNWKENIISEKITILTDTNLNSSLPELAEYKNVIIKNLLEFSGNKKPTEIQTFINSYFGGTIAFVSTLIITIVIAGVMWKDFAYDFRYKLSKNIFKSLLFIIGGIVLMFAGLYLSELIIELIIKAANIDFIGSENQKTINLLLENNSQAIFIKLTAILLAPIIEELIFRKTIFKLIRSKGMAIYVSSLSFGLIHVISMYKAPEMMLLNLIPYFMGGLVLSSIYSLNQKNIYIPIIVHMSYNLIGILI